MTLSWSTLILEIINFLILLWLLQHFLYQPVQRLLARRQADIERSLVEAKQQKQQAEALHQQYQQQLSNWQKQRLEAKAELDLELQKHRQQAMEQLQQKLDSARQQEQVITERQRDRQRQQDQQQALDNACRFASRLLKCGCGPELESRLIELWIEQFDQLPDELLQALRREQDQHLTVETSQPIDDNLRQALQQRISHLLQRDDPWHEKLNPKLIAGIRLSLGGHVLGANLEDELHAFSQLATLPEPVDEC